MTYVSMGHLRYMMILIAIIIMIMIIRIMILMVIVIILSNYNMIYYVLFISST